MRANLAKKKMIKSLVKKFVPEVKLTFLPCSEMRTVAGETKVAAITEFDTYNGDAPIRIIVSEDIITNTTYSMERAKMYILHEIGHCLFVTGNLSDDEVAAEEFVYFYAKIHKDRELYDCLLTHVKSFNVETEPYKSAYHKIARLATLYKF